jgi:tetratricopeptide (TPR) repeat protein
MKRMVRLLPRVLVFAVAAAFAVPASAQDWKGMGRLEGKVLDDKGAPIEGASVKLARASDGGGTTLKTDKKGRWAIGGIAAGTWNADVEAAGYAPKNISVNLPSESARLAPVEVRLEKAVAAGPSPEVTAALGQAEADFQAGRYAEARAGFEKLLALRPDVATTIHQRIGFTYIQEKQYDKALEHLQKVLDAEPNNAMVRGIMAQAALEGGMLDRGLELLKGIDEASIKSPDIFFNIGINLINANRPEEAITYFTKAVTLDPAYADGYFRRGLAYLGAGKTAEAKADLNKFLELQPAGAQADLARKAVAQIK